MPPHAAVYFRPNNAGQAELVSKAATSCINNEGGAIYFNAQDCAFTIKVMPGAQGMPASGVLLRK